MYSRFKALEGYGEEELEKIKGSKVAVVGLGATGSIIAEHLARHGVELVLIDRDYLEENDIYSSGIYGPESCEESIPKAVAAEKYLSSFTDTKSMVESLNSENIHRLEDVDLIMDGTDNLETRLLIDEFSRKEGIPWIYTAALAEKGYSMFFDKKCFNCIFETVKPGKIGTCQSNGIMREISTIAASYSSMDAIKYLSGKKLGEKLKIIPSGEELEVDSKDCAVCEEGKFEKLNSETDVKTVCGDGKYQIDREVSENGSERLKKLGDTVADNSYLTRVEIDGDSFTLFSSGRTIIEAKDKNHAEQKFSEILGN